MTVCLIPAPHDPWRHNPQFASIWPEPYATEAREASAADWRSGMIHLIAYEVHVVGITGYFFIPGDDKNVYLRWHGVVPEMRGKGIGRVAIRLLALMLSEYFPTRSLVELAPDNEYGKTVEPFFAACGFVKQAERVSYCGEMWWPWHLDLGNFK